MLDPGTAYKIGEALRDAAPLRPDLQESIALVVADTRIGDPSPRVAGMATAEIIAEVRSTVREQDIADLLAEGEIDDYLADAYREVLSAEVVPLNDGPTCPADEDGGF